MKLRFSASFVLWMFFSLCVAAQDVVKCDICGAVINGEYRHVEDNATGEVKNVCMDCWRLEQKCFICGLPVRENFETLPDGRLICERDSKEAVSSEDDAKQICQDVRNDLDRVLGRWMTYPDTNVLISIVNRYYLEGIIKSPTEGQDCVSVYGATGSHRLPGDRVFHSVAILSHLRKPRLMATCAHELTHTWINENVPGARRETLDKNTLEAFCELVAYKYMESRGETFEMDAIKKNNYTHGQIDVLVAADAAYGFNAVVDWMKNGDDAKLTEDRLDRIRAINGNYVPSPSAPVALITGPVINASVAQPLAKAPATLTLKGISGSGARRFALINDATFETMEKGKVRVGGSNVVVRCLEIRNDSVTIQIDGSNERKQLFLRGQ